MKYNKIVCLGLILIMFFTVTVTATEKKKIFNSPEEFILEVYKNYQEKKFESVYKFMHSDIKDNLEKEKYIKFQVENTKKYNIKISEVEVIKVNEIEEWPKEYKELINNKGNHKLYEIAMKYKAIYQSDQKEKTIEKNSYVVLYKDNYYLLWDPEIIK